MILQFDDIINWFLGAGAVVMIIVGLALFIVALLLPIFLLQWGVKIAKGDKPSFGSAFITYLITLVIGWAVNFAIGLVPTIPYAATISSVAALLLGALVVSKRHNTSFGGGLIALIIPGIIIAILLVILVVVLVLAFGLVIPGLPI